MTDFLLSSGGKHDFLANINPRSYAYGFFLGKCLCREQQRVCCNVARAYMAWTRLNLFLLQFRQQTRDTRQKATQSDKLRWEKRCRPEGRQEAAAIVGPEREDERWYDQDDIDFGEKVGDCFCKKETKVGPRPLTIPQNPSSPGWIAHWGSGLTCHTIQYKPRDGRAPDKKLMAKWEEQCREEMYESAARKRASRWLRNVRVLNQPPRGRTAPPPNNPLQFSLPELKDAVTDTMQRYWRVGDDAPAAPVGDPGRGGTRPGGSGFRRPR